MIFYSSFLVAMFTAIMLIPPFTYLYQKMGIVDIPSERKVHTTPIPRVGGIAIVIASIIPIAIWLKLELTILGVLLGIGILFVLGIVDDIKNLNYKSKFIFQISAIIIIFFSGFVEISNSHFYSNDFKLNALIFSLYFLFILGVTNAINLSDGLDGLAGGEALLSFSIIGLLAYESNNITILVIVLSVIGAIFGFLRFNTYPAKIFMGDTGSLYLGFVLGLLSVALTYGADNAYSKFLPILLVGLPLFDTLMVIIIRIIHKQSPFNADRNHLHHKLLDNGFKHYQSVIIIYSIQSVFVLSAYFLRYSIDINILIAFFVISLIAIIVGRISIVNMNQPAIISNNLLVRLSGTKEAIQSKSNLIFILLSCTIFIYAITSVVRAEIVNNDILIVLAAIIVITVIDGIYYKNKPCGWIERIAIHIMIVLNIYLSIYQRNDSVIQMLHISMLMLCVGLIALMIFTSSNKNFSGSPLDFLLIATAIAVPNLPQSPLSDSGIGITILQLIVLFYCVEYILFNVVKNWWTVRAAVIMIAGIPIIYSIT